MIKVKMAEVSSRLGNFTIIKMGQAVLISPCGTRMKILEALSTGPMTGEELVGKIDVSYSCVMDHMDFFEKLGIVEATLKRNGGGRRRICFQMSEDPLEAIERLFMTAPRNDRGGSAAIVRAQPSTQT
ncbi:MAG: winged helix-turn-helix domain-containing protein [Thaumarchaeota archaeon]|jgi:DNA-binding PadR family transcriptional regulator|nr:winged helix-turn-helix domain-containing protein [Nitrososphaerota archaeon]